MPFEIPLTQGRFALVDEVDAEWALGYRWCVTNGYPARGGTWERAGKVWYMHREILVRAGELTDYFADKKLTDHRDRDRFNNTRGNLRAVAFSINNSNRECVARSGLLGVEQQTSRGKPIEKWSWGIMREGKRHRRYGFDSPEAAAVDRAAFVAASWPDE